MSTIKRTSIFTLLVFFLMVIPTFAEMDISNLELKAVVSNNFIVQYSWEMDVSFGEDKSEKCILKISFYDDNGFEIYSKSGYVSLSPGSNHVTGQGVCRPDVWQKTKEYKARIQCR